MPDATGRRQRRTRLARRVGGLVVLSAAVAALAPATSSAALVDFDNDGLGHIEERLKYGTDPWKADTDSDGLKDGEEVKTYTTSPTKADTDGDVLKDGEEVKTYKTDPKKRDTDGDVADDNYEIYDYGTNPLKPDTDGDGFSDGAEVYDNFNSSDPNDAGSVPYHGSRPVVKIDSVSKSGTVARYTFSSTDPNATYKCTLTAYPPFRDSYEFVRDQPCTSPAAYDLRDYFPPDTNWAQALGITSFRVTATDADGDMTWATG